MNNKYILSGLKDIFEVCDSFKFIVLTFLLFNILFMGYRY